MRIIVQQVRPFSIHGDFYYEVLATALENPEEGLSLRVPQHAVSAAPKPGDRLAVTFLMGQVTAAVPVTTT